MFAVLGALSLLAAAFALLAVGGIYAIIFVAIASLFFVGHAIIVAVERESSALIRALEMHARMVLGQEPREPLEPKKRGFLWWRG